MQIPILSGVYTDSTSEFGTTYPKNLIPVPKPQGISNGYLRPSEGMVLFADGVGADRGGVEWLGLCYRVQGTKLVRVNADGTVTEIGEVGSDGQYVTFDYSFVHLAILSNKNLFLYDGTTLTQVTAIGGGGTLGPVLDVVWVDGYFLMTDGEFLLVTELNNPFTVDINNYAASEIDPDGVLAVLKLRNEVYAVNRNTIEVFSNIGGANFPFSRRAGAQIHKGAIGTKAATVMNDAIAFVGGSANEDVGVYLAAGGSANKISTRDIDKILSSYPASQIADVFIESRNFLSHEWLYVHLPDRTLLFDMNASNEMGQLIWVVLTSGTIEFERYQARGFVQVYDKWIAGHPVDGRIATLSMDISSHFSEIVSWEFGTEFVFNDGNGALVHNVELVCLTGEGVLGKESVIMTSYSLDGITWSQHRSTKAGGQGERGKRIAWRRQGNMKNFRAQKFVGTSDAHISIARLDVEMEALAF